MISFVDNKACERASLLPECAQTIKCYRGRLLVSVRDCKIEGLRNVNGWVNTIYFVEQVSNVEMDGIVSVTTSSGGISISDPTAFQDKLWPTHGYFGTDASKMWEVTTGSPGVSIAILDTGLHKNLMTPYINHLTNGYDFVSDVDHSNDGDGRDGDYHDPGPGTACQNTGGVSYHGSVMASIIASNNPQLKGMSKDATIMPIRVLSGCGTGSASDLADGIAFASGQPIDGVPEPSTISNVILLAVNAYGSCPSYLQTVINIAVRNNIIIVASAGNNMHARTSDYYPSNCEGVISIGSSTKSGGLSLFSNLGFHVAAPGGDERTPITVMSPNIGATNLFYVSVFGTSISAAYAASFIVLGKLAYPNTFHVGHSILPWPNNCLSSRCGAGILKFFKEGRAIPYVQPNVGQGLYECSGYAQRNVIHGTLSISQMEALTPTYTDTFNYIETETGDWKQKRVNCTYTGNHSVVAASRASASSPSSSAFTPSSITPTAWGQIQEVGNTATVIVGDGFTFQIEAGNTPIQEAQIDHGRPAFTGLKTLRAQIYGSVMQSRRFDSRTDGLILFEFSIPLDFSQQSGEMYIFAIETDDLNRVTVRIHSSPIETGLGWTYATIETTGASEIIYLSAPLEIIGYDTTNTVSYSSTATMRYVMDIDSNRQSLFSKIDYDSSGKVTDSAWKAWLTECSPTGCDENFRIPFTEDDFRSECLAGRWNDCVTMSPSKWTVVELSTSSNKLISVDVVRVSSYPINWYIDGTSFEITSSCEGDQLKALLEQYPPHAKYLGISYNVDTVKWNDLSGNNLHSVDIHGSPVVGVGEENGARVRQVFVSSSGNITFPIDPMIRDYSLCATFRRNVQGNMWKTRCYTGTIGPQVQSPIELCVGWPTGLSNAEWEINNLIVWNIILPSGDISSIEYWIERSLLAREISVASPGKCNVGLDKIYSCIPDHVPDVLIHAQILAENYDTERRVFVDSTGKFDSEPVTTGRLTLATINGVTQVTGNGNATVYFGVNSLPREFTLCSLTRYTSNASEGDIITANVTMGKKRIKYPSDNFPTSQNGKGNWFSKLSIDNLGANKGFFHGHHQGKVGTVAYGDTKLDLQGRFPKANFIATCSSNKPGSPVAINGDLYQSSSQQGYGGAEIVINPITLGNSKSTSNTINDWALSAMYVWNQHLPDVDMKYVSSLLHQSITNTAIKLSNIGACDVSSLYKLPRTCRRRYKSDQVCGSSFSCPVGTQPNNNYSDCEPCPKGTASSISRRDACPACPVGRYATGSGNVKCIKCPFNTYSTIVGATNISDCQRCPETLVTREMGVGSPNSCMGCPTS